VDDTPIVRAAVALMLQTAGYEVDEAADGFKALSIFKPGLYAAIVMDYNMPKMNGFECAAKIRELESETDSRTPIICMSTANEPDMKEKCLKAGLDDFLDKECSPAELAAVLKRLTDK
jgi:CheY-like chemotaxis protein